MRTGCNTKHSSVVVDSVADEFGNGVECLDTGVDAGVDCGGASGCCRAILGIVGKVRENGVPSLPESLRISHYMEGCVEDCMRDRGAFLAQEDGSEPVRGRARLGDLYAAVPNDACDPKVAEEAFFKPSSRQPCIYGESRTGIYRLAA
jgi:hypothetical protein